MKAISIVKKIKSLGGDAQTELEEGVTTYGRFIRVHTTGTLNGYDIEMIGDDAGFFTARHISKKDFYDAGSDYNPGGYQFLDKVKDLDWIASL